ncbi:MAG: hypothetical protein HZB18_16685 [Chloroflexi bacterium]|nr:hypothetical protein [Chloroflexota bacterium]
MQKFIDRNKFHLLLWGFMLVYLFFAHDLYIKFFLSDADGQPIAYEKKLPPETKEIGGGLGSLSYLERGLYSLNGSAFLRSDPDNTHFEKWIILHSETKTYFFSVITSSRQIKVHLSREFIQPGSYRIGILFKGRQDKTEYYRITNKMLIRTPNYLLLEPVEK